MEDTSLINMEKIYNQTDKALITDKKIYSIFKRCIDIMGSLVGIAILLPLLIIVAVSIKIEDSKGTVLFKQKRIGKDGKPFYMYKFRSMVSNAEKMLDSLMVHNETTGAMFKMKNDPRVTKIGKFIRRTSIDELPQLWNVLKGDMSLVGPRPPLLHEYKQYSDFHKQRCLVTPGCTGLWQIGGRSSIGFEEMVNLDLLYIKKRSVLFDLIIIIKTIRVLFGSKDAY